MAMPVVGRGGTSERGQGHNGDEGGGQHFHNSLSEWLGANLRTPINFDLMPTGVKGSPLDDGDDEAILQPASQELADLQRGFVLSQRLAEMGAKL